MKKVIVKKIQEEAKYFCDKHPDRECYTQIITMCWYGSQFDLNHIKANLCDECLGELYKFMEEKFGVKAFDDEMSMMHCPLCER